MPGAVRETDVCTGHGCFSPRPAIQGSTDTFVNGLPQHRLADQWGSHCCAGCHGGVAVAGSPDTFVNGLQAERVGDPVDCGSSMASGSPDTFIN